MRYSVQSSLQRYLKSDVLLNIRALYQNQAKTEYLLMGFSMAKLFGSDNQQMVGLGCWYRTNDAFTPTLLFEYNKLQFGLSYDITVSKFNPAVSNTTSWELSLLYKIGDGSWLH